jgi:hypothetical protein
MLILISLSYSNSKSKNVNISLQGSIFKKTLRLNCVQRADFTGKMFIGPIRTFGTIQDSQTSKNLTPDLGVGVRVDIVSGVGSGSGLPQMLILRQSGQIIFKTSCFWL